MGTFDGLWGYGLVFLFSAIPFFEAYAVIPLAILAGLSTLPVIILGLAGNILTVLLVILFLDKIKQWRKKRKGDDEDTTSPTKRSIRAKKLWIKYGLPGLAFIGPLLVGSHLTTFMSVTLGGTKQSTANWMVASLVIWCSVFTVLAYLGIDFLNLGERNLFQAN
ncbi:small multi-drug export protein [Ammoniphilus sp. CFH 90114]|uniref:small multi-drug export protein n=1 Tax=Ammoniphilus sp. CFH 90114 TaxID=2493665 RepID=UPI00100F10D0|nr:small multi-drug export protein [Ammoniphilus sp. CFH 90114]RXT07160.1 DNA-binding protein [Ammoniphilus sp. CFH 90114]